MFRRIKPDSVTSYSLVLHRLIFNCIRYYVREGWTSKYRYPVLDPSQVDTLKKLDHALDEAKDKGEIDPIFHEVCNALFAHQKHQYDCSWKSETRFFSPVICFQVIHAVTENGGTPFCSGISNIVAPVMYAIRACIFRNVMDRVSKERISVHE